MNMRKENKDLLMKLLQQHKVLGISDQIDFDKSYMDSLIANSVTLSDPYPDPFEEEMVDKWTREPSIAEKLVDIWGFVVDKDKITTDAITSHFGYPETETEQYLCQLTELGYLEAHGGNKNRTYSKK
jgi:hypothetical protein